MTLKVDVAARIGAFQLDAHFGGGTGGGLTALFGPSGSGKTTVVEMVGGIRRPDHGRITVGERVLVDTETRIFVPPHRRRIGWVFQEGRLFPHLTGRQNLMYGQWFTPRQARRESLSRIVDLLGIGHLLDRRPDGYSGGERSRVAIGRALMASPEILLMDEPLAALDDDRKAEILPHIERLRDEAGVEILYVTHSMPEVIRLASRVVMMASGRVVASGDTAEVLSRFDMAAAVGEADAGAVVDVAIESHDRDFALTRLRGRIGQLHVAALDLPVGTSVRLRIKARDVMLARDLPHAISALNILSGTIRSLSPRGPSSIDAAIDCGGDILLANLTRRSAHDLQLAAGVPVYAIVKSVTFDRLGMGTLARS